EEVRSWDPESWELAEIPAVFFVEDSCGDSRAAVLSEDRAEGVMRVWAILENDERKTGKLINISKTGELLVSAPKTRLSRRCCVPIAKKGKGR
ncbi:hypothetical protein LEMLEM_LOCUS15129, partial [Lemmus lemmus]